MSLTLSIYDLFAYAIPGSLYLALLAYLGDRLGWVSLEGATSLSTTILLIGAVLASYLLWSTDVSAWAVRRASVAGIGEDDSQCTARVSRICFWTPSRVCSRGRSILPVYCGAD
jgi:predicted benzoate:H+ symporter BenE